MTWNQFVDTHRILKNIHTNQINQTRLSNQTKSSSVIVIYREA